jgi:hypothetical protein
LEESQSRIDGAGICAEELRAEPFSLERRLNSQKEALLSSTAGYEMRTRAAYKGDHLEGLASVLDGSIDSAGAALIVDDPRLSAHPSRG